MANLILQDVVAGYFDRDVLRGASLALGSGFHVLLGANGSGKTTLFRVCTGVLQPRRGTVRLWGAAPAEAGVRRRVGYLPHRAGLSSGLTVRDALGFWARVLELPADQERSETESLIQRLNLGELLPRRMGTLSRGQQQRVSVARALLGSPSLLVLDEPTSGLDPLEARRMRALLKELGKERTILYSTHNVYEAADLAETVLVLVGGRIVLQGPIDELLRHLPARDGAQREPASALEEIFERLNAPEVAHG